MTAPSVLERCRMALAEIGMSRDEVWIERGHVRMRPDVDPSLAWMLWQTVAWTQRWTLCWPCFAWAWRAQMDLPDCERLEFLRCARGACGAWRPFQRESCGAQP